MINYSNFKLTKVHGESLHERSWTAEIDVTTSFFGFNEKITTYIIHKKFSDNYWYYIADGEYLPNEMKKAVRSFEATHGEMHLIKVGKYTC